MEWLLGVLALGVCLACAGAITPVANAHGDDSSGQLFGISEPDAWRFHPAHASSAEIASLVEEIGASTHEFWVHWDTVEPQPPVDGQHDYDFADYDRMYRADLARGIRPMITVQSSPAWTWRSDVTHTWLPEHPPAPDHYDDWRAFLEALTERYPEAVGIQIWNEPNLTYFWGLNDPVVPTNASDYTDLLREGHAAIKSADPTMPVIAGGLSNNPVSEDGHIAINEFLDQMLDLGAVSYMDGLALHPYPGSPNLEHFDRSMSQVRALLSDRGISIPLWVTEVGITTSGDRAVTESQQADVLVSIMRSLRNAPDVAAVYFHNLTEPTQDPQNPEMGYGLVSGRGEGASFRRKPAFLALQRAVRNSSQEPAHDGATNLSLTASARLIQPIKRRRLALEATCNSRCRLTAQAEVKFGRRRGGASLQLTSLTRDAAADRTIRLRLPLPTKVVARARSAMAQGGRVIARISVLASDHTGATQQRHLRILLTG
jgi:hypothetical protein